MFQPPQWEKIFFVYPFEFYERVLTSINCFNWNKKWDDVLQFKHLPLVLCVVNEHVVDWTWIWNFMKIYTY